MPLALDTNAAVVTMNASMPEGGLEAEKIIHRGRLLACVKRTMT